MSGTTHNENEVKGRIARGRSLALIIALAGLAVSFAGMFGVFGDTKLAFQGYHFGFFYWLLLGLGCLGMSLLAHATRGQWTLPLIRIWESGARTIPIIMLLYVPVLALGMKHVYEWMHAEHVAEDPVLQGKAPFFFFPQDYTGTPIFFLVRFVFYAVVWFLMANYLWKKSLEQDKAKDPIEGEILSRRRTGPVSGMIVAFMLVFTLAMVDFGQSLMPHWFSTMYAFIMVTGGSFLAVALAVYMVLSWRDLSLYAGKIAYMPYRRDWGNFLFTLTVFWSYLSFSQLLITYSGNLYEFTQFYLRRNTEGWQYLAYLIVIFHFFVPFFLFLAPRTKKVVPQLLAGTILVMAIRTVDIFWQIKPFFAESLSICTFDISAFLGFGGLWFYLALGYLTQRALLPQNEARLMEVAHGHS